MPPKATHDQPEQSSSRDASNEGGSNSPDWSANSSPDLYASSLPDIDPPSNNQDTSSSPSDQNTSSSPNRDSGTSPVTRSSSNTWLQLTPTTTLSVPSDTTRSADPHASPPWGSPLRPPRSSRARQSSVANASSSAEQPPSLPPPPPEETALTELGPPESDAEFGRPPPTYGQATALAQTGRFHPASLGDAARVLFTLPIYNPRGTTHPLSPSELPHRPLYPERDEEATNHPPTYDGASESDRLPVPEVPPPSSASGASTTNTSVSDAPSLSPQLMSPRTILATQPGRPRSDTVRHVSPSINVPPVPAPSSANERPVPGAHSPGDNPSEPQQPSPPRPTLDRQAPGFRTYAERFLSPAESLPAGPPPTVASVESEPSGASFPDQSISTISLGEPAMTAPGPIDAPALIDTLSRLVPQTPGSAEAELSPHRSNSSGSITETENGQAGPSERTNAPMDGRARPRRQPSPLPLHLVNEALERADSAFDEPGTSSSSESANNGNGMNGAPVPPANTINGLPVPPGTQFFNGVPIPTAPDNGVPDGESESDWVREQIQMGGLPSSLLTPSIESTDSDPLTMAPVGRRIADIDSSKLVEHLMSVERLHGLQRPPSLGAPQTRSERTSPDRLRQNLPGISHNVDRMDGATDAEPRDADSSEPAAERPSRPSSAPSRFTGQASRSQWSPSPAGHSAQSQEEGNLVHSPPSPQRTPRPWLFFDPSSSPHTIVNGSDPRVEQALQRLSVAPEPRDDDTFGTTFSHLTQSAEALSRRVVHRLEPDQQSPTRQNPPVQHRLPIEPPSPRLRAAFMTQQAEQNAASAAAVEEDEQRRAAVLSGPLPTIGSLISAVLDPTISDHMLGWMIREQTRRTGEPNAVPPEQPGPPVSEGSSLAQRQPRAAPPQPSGHAGLLERRDTLAGVEEVEKREEVDVGAGELVWP